MKADSRRDAPAQITAVIFDMDGLMLNIEPLYREAFKRTAAEFGYEATDDLHSRVIGRGAAETERVIREAFGAAFPMEAFWARWLEAACEGGPVPKKPGLDELLDYFDSRGFRKAVATSTVRRIAEPQLIATGLFDRFDAVATGDEVRCGKPAPDLFLLAARRLGAQASECLVLEDAEPGVVAAHRAGMAVYIVPDLQVPADAVRQLASGTFSSLGAVTLYLREHDGHERDER